jgi:hypothetical protein
MRSEALNVSEMCPLKFEYHQLRSFCQEVSYVTTCLQIVAEEMKNSSADKIQICRTDG